MSALFVVGVVPAREETLFPVSVLEKRGIRFPCKMREKRDVGLSGGGIDPSVRIRSAAQQPIR